MKCAKCNAPLGSTYLICPSCGFKVTASASSPTIAIPSIAVGFPPNLVLPPRRRVLPLTIFGVVLALCSAIGLIVANSMMREVLASATAKFDDDWDRLQIQPVFETRSLFGTRPLASDSASYEIRGSGGRILYQGANSRPKIAEGLLATREVLQIKACLSVEKPFSSQTESYCANTELIGSEKRVVVLSQSVRLSAETAPEQLQYLFTQEKQRKPFSGEGRWQSLGETTDPIFLELWVGHDMARKLRVRVVPAGSLQDVDLRQGEGFSSFELAFLEAENRSHDIPINAQFVFKDGDRSTLHQPISLRLRTKTDEERLAELRNFARILAKKVVEDNYMGGNDVQPTLVNWHFDRRTRTYSADAQFDWRGKFFAGNTYWIRGDLQISENGSDGKFSLNAEGDAIRTLKNNGVVAGLGAVFVIKLLGEK